MNKKFYNAEKERQMKYYNEHLSKVAKNYGEFRGTHEYVLKREDCLCNLFKPIRKDALEYFDKHNITWWGENKRVKLPTGHLVSSQVHCLNHLFAIRKDDDAMKAVIENATGLQIEKVLLSPIDNDGYITFEFVCENKLLLGEKNQTRGAKCTSIDALVYVQLKDGRKVLVPIEWKYTETYSGIEAKDDSLVRYPQRVLSSSNLIREQTGNYDGHPWNKLYNADPYYELMRQTLLVEQIIAHKESAKIKADDYIHIVIIPEQHTELRKAIESKYIPTLHNESKFHIIDPHDLLEPIANKYPDLINYLSTRYWS